LPRLCSREHTVIRLGEKRVTGLGEKKAAGVVGDTKVYQEVNS
jgi:hypothetical protein